MTLGLLPADKPRHMPLVYAVIAAAERTQQQQDPCCAAIGKQDYSAVAVL